MPSDTRANILALLAGSITLVLILFPTIYIWDRYPDFHNIYFRGAGVGLSAGLGCYVYNYVYKKILPNDSNSMPPE